MAHECHPSIKGRIIWKTSLIFWLVFSANCSGLGPAQFLNPDSLNADISQTEQVDSDAAENPGTFTLEPKSFDVAIDGQNHEVTITEDSITVDGAIYAIPEDYQDGGQVITLDLEQILSGGSPFGQSAATATPEDEAAVPADDAGLNEPITVAQLPAPMPKEEGEPTTEEETTSTVAAPITQGDGWTSEETEEDEDSDLDDEEEDLTLERPEFHIPSKGQKSGNEPSVYLVPTILVSPCSDIEDSELPPALREIRITLSHAKSPSSSTLRVSAAQNEDSSDCPEEEDEVTPLTCTPITNSKTGQTNCKWQILAKQITPKTRQAATTKKTAAPLPSIEPAPTAIETEITELPTPVPAIEPSPIAAPALFAPKTAPLPTLAPSKISPTKVPRAY